MRRRVVPIFWLSCILITVTTLLVPCREVAAKETEIPPIVLAGLSAYEAEGAEAAFKAWLSGSALEGDKTALSQANVFRQVESLYGSYQGFDLIEVVAVTPKTKLVYLQINLQKGPLFAYFTCYREKSGWIITALKFHTEAAEIIPSKVLYRSPTG